MLIVIGEGQAAPGRREELLAAASAMAAETRLDDGCASYGFFADPDRPDVVVNVEVWRDRAALDAHLAHQHTEEFLAAVPEMVAGAPEMRWFDAEPTTQDAR